MEDYKVSITDQHITYDELQHNSFQLCDDKYGLAAYVLTKSRRDVILSCPDIPSPLDGVIYLRMVDGVIAARTTKFGTLLKVNSEFYPMSTGSALEVHEKYRHLALGIEFFAGRKIETDYDYKYTLAAGISSMALPLYRVMKYHILAFPRLMQLRNSRCMLEAIGLKGKTLSLSSKIADFLIFFLHKSILYVTAKKHSDFVIKQEKVIPKWVEKMTLEDGHKYAEVHNCKWLQWNLDYNFRGLKEDIQSFYSVFKNGEPVGFFMTKERFRKEAGGKMHNIIIGSIVEWGTKDAAIIDETMLYDLAMPTFSTKVDIVEVATTDKITVKKLKRRLFFPHGFAHVAFKDRTKKFKDASDINLWRLRLGYADVILT